MMTIIAVYEAFVKSQLLPRGTGSVIVLRHRLLIRSLSSRGGRPAWEPQARILCL